MQVPKTFQDYDKDDDNIHKRLGRWRFWETIVDLKREYETNISFEAEPFLIWLEEKYGIRVIRDSIENGLTDEYKIIDEQKFLIFLLKHSER